jgi:DNA-binding response OmpR family regulator
MAHGTCVNMVVKNVLIVEDETPFLISLTDGLAAYGEDFTVLSALNGREAVKILDSTEVDLVVTDLRMPKMDGFELLAHMSGQYPNMPVIVMTAYGTPEIEERLQDMGIFQYLEKPLEFNFLVDRIFDIVKNGSSPDRIHRISLAAFLQLLEMENKTCTLTVKSRGREGQLYFAKGALHQAETGDMKGEKAALDIIGWDNVAMEIQYTCNVKKKSIGLPVAEILMEGFRIKDDKESTKGKEETMDIKKLNGIIKNLTEDLDDALLTTDIWAVADGLSIAGYNSNPKAVALFNRMGKLLDNALQGSKFPGIDRHYMLHLKNDTIMMGMPLGDYQWGLLIDAKKAQLGLLMNVIIPNTIAAIKSALGK